MWWRISNGAIITVHGWWKVLSIRPGFPAPAIGQPIGFWWVKRKGGAGRIVSASGRKRSRTFMCYVYPLEKDFRTRLGLAAGAGLGPLGTADGLDGKN